MYWEAKKKLFDSLYGVIYFIVVAWNQKHNISKVFRSFYMEYLPLTSIHVSLFFTKMPMSGVWEEVETDPEGGNARP